MLNQTHELNAFETLWLDYFGSSSNPTLTLALTLFIWHEIVYFGRYVPYLILDYIPYFQKYKIQVSNI